MKIPILATFVSIINCSGQSYTNTFDVNPPLGGEDSSISAPGLWYIDRKAPATFTSEIFEGDSRLNIGVNANDYSGDPGGNFYDTQGRKFYLTDSGIGSLVSAELYIPSTWANVMVAPGLWLTAVDNVGDAAAFPTIGFFSDGTGDSGGSFFRVWDDTGSYLNMNTSIAWDNWNTLTIHLTTDGFVYGINGADVYTDTAAARSASIANVMFESRNYGTSYDTHWDNLITPSSTEAVPEPKTIAMLSIGGFLLWRMKRFDFSNNKTTN